MLRLGRKTSASRWRTFFYSAALAAALPATRVPAFAQGASGSAGSLTADEATRLVQEVRQADIAGDYYFEFELVAMPRRGEERTFRGRWWGSRNAQGPIRRIEITDADGAKQRLLLQNGERAALWRWAGGQARVLGAADLFTPLLPGVELTPFDLQMPFLFWSDAVLQGQQRIRNRGTHVFLFRAPAQFDAGGSGIAAARVFLDAQLNAIMQTELLDARGRVLKRFSPLALKVVDGQPVPKTIDFRNDATGAKARLQFAAVALKLEYDDALFEPRALGQEVPGPATQKLVRLD